MTWNFLYKNVLKNYYKFSFSITCKYIHRQIDIRLFTCTYFSYCHFQNVIFKQITLFHLRCQIYWHKVIFFCSQSQQVADEQSNPSFELMSNALFTVSSYDTSDELIDKYLLISFHVPRFFYAMEMKMIQMTALASRIPQSGRGDKLTPMILS